MDDRYISCKAIIKHLCNLMFLELYFIHGKIIRGRIFISFISQSLYPLLKLMKSWQLSPTLAYLPRLSSFCSSFIILYPSLFHLYFLHFCIFLQPLLPLYSLVWSPLTLIHLITWRSILTNHHNFISPAPIYLYPLF